MIDENDLDEKLFDIFGSKLNSAHQKLTFSDPDALRQVLFALDNLYALLSHKLMGEETR